MSFAQDRRSNRHRSPLLGWSLILLLGFSGVASTLSILRETQQKRAQPPQPPLATTRLAHTAPTARPVPTTSDSLPAQLVSHSPGSRSSNTPQDSIHESGHAPVAVPESDDWREVLRALPRACLSGMPELETAESPEAIAPSTSSSVDVRPETSSEGFGASHDNIAQTSWLLPNDDPNAASGPPTSATHVYRPRSDLASVEAFFDPHRQATEAGRVLDVDPTQCGEDPHAEVFRDTPYPSATACAKCHRQIYEEWAVSNHAYASISPMFTRFEDTLNRLSQGTVGYFCLRCHAPVATTMGLRRDQPLVDGPRVFREGVTCVACHRVTEQYGKVNGERRMEPGSIVEPVVGAGDGLGVERTLRDRDRFLVRDTLEGQGQAMHRRAIQFEQLSRSDFCVSCHQVAVYPNIKLEVVWDQYIASPAYREGVTCQDCHMGKVPGLAEGYSVGPCAIIDGRPVLPERKHSNHLFYGPGYSVAHPGVFPHNEQADRWTVQEWLLFDWRAGWGTDAFEQALERGEFRCDFPPPWNDVEVRYEAREVLETNFKALAYKRETRKQVMENGARIDGPFFRDGCEREGRHVVPAGQPLRFHYTVTNLNSGHNLPTASLGAQPQLWLNVVLVDPRGQRVWETGYLDSQGDLADLQSDDVLTGKLPHDDQLFNLQTKFLITNVKGTDREVYLPVNTDVDQLPFLRPPGLPVSVLNHPPLIRMEAHSLPPLGSREARYRIPGDRLTIPGWYRLSVRMRSRAEPPYFMRFVEATPEMIRRMTEEIQDCHPYTVTFEVE